MFITCLSIPNIHSTRADGLCVPCQLLSAQNPAWPIENTYYLSETEGGLGGGYKRTAVGLSQ